MNYVMPASVLGLVFLTACGGGGSNLDSYANKFELGDAIADQIDGRPFTQPSTLPMMGGAQYNGVVAADLPGDGGGSATVIGDLELNANFADSTIGGRMDDFVDGEGTRYNGAIRVQDAEIRRNIDPDSDYTFVNDIDGRLTGGGQTYDVDGELLGDFYGSARRYTAGEVAGLVTSGGRTERFEGEFVAEQ